MRDTWLQAQTTIIVTSHDDGSIHAPLTGKEPETGAARRTLPAQIPVLSANKPC